MEDEYNAVIKALRTLPTHVFVLQLRENEIESRSSHPERGVAWHKYQQHIIEREGYRNFVRRNVCAESDGRNSPTSKNSFLDSPIAVGARRELPNVGRQFWILVKISMQPGLISPKIKSAKTSTPESYIIGISQTGNDTAILFEKIGGQKMIVTDKFVLYISQELAGHLSQI